jgi:hypothetical protein
VIGGEVFKGMILLTQVKEVRIGIRSPDDAARLIVLENEASASELGNGNGRKKRRSPH